ncbi:class I SAM-dependent methyltransferase [Actinoplanes sp. NPDC023936]|uniref:class I SAM-dependent methyltransferase n=1 Tax=Actinoplanes sp. NPDC023936 TaxID=3154910 RepID=UPI0033C3E227
MGVQSLRWQIVDRPGSLGDRMRTKRRGWLSQQFPDLAEMSVIDLGGRASSWVTAAVRPKHVHIVNLEGETGLENGEVPSWAEVDFGDACDLPEAIRKRRYDLVFSNSVIEHVGGHERRMRLADAVHSLADAHWVQTPYRYFPIEPHFVAPGMQFLPNAAQAVMARKWPLVHTPPADKTGAIDSVLWVELLDKTQMRSYFPHSQLISERFAGLTKSLIAIKKP